MKTIFIFHGFGGSAEKNWFPWLKEQLTTIGHRVIAPSFPRSNDPKISEWMEFFRHLNTPPDEDSIFIGHSLGGLFALRLLEKIKTHIDSCILVAPVSKPMNNDIDAHIMTFFSEPLDWKRIQERASRFHILHASNDPYIPLSHAEELAQHLKAPLTVIEKGGHLNAASGFSEFPQLLKIIEDNL